MNLEKFRKERIIAFFDSEYIKSGFPNLYNRFIQEVIKGDFANLHLFIKNNLCMDAVEDLIIKF